MTRLEMKDRTMATILELTKAADLQDEAMILRGLLLDEIRDAVTKVGIPKSINDGTDDVPQEICANLAREFRARAKNYLDTAVPGIVPGFHQALCRIAAIFEPNMDEEEETTATEEEEVAEEEAWADEEEAEAI